LSVRSIRTERNHVARIVIKLGVHAQLQVRRFRAVRVRSVEDGWALDGAERFRPQDTLAATGSGG
jgi:hypothetical protein